MEWYPWAPAAYKADTMHLTPYQDGCYRRLIDHYMETRQPLPDSDAALARIVGDSLENWMALAVEAVRPFFTPASGRLHLKRCDAILADQNERSKASVEAGRRGAAARWGKNINGNKDDDSHPNSHPIATPMRSDSTGQDRTGHNNTSPKGEDIITPKAPKSEKPMASKPEGVSKQVWDDFLALRRRLKAPLTETALEGIQREADKAHMPLKEVLSLCCARGWRGFNHEWLKREGNRNGNATRSTTGDDRSSPALDQFRATHGDLDGDPGNQD